MTNLLKRGSIAHQYLTQLITVHEAKLETLMFSTLNMIIEFSISNVYFSFKYIAFPLGAAGDYLVRNLNYFL